jgi:hypothetical protein
VKLRTSSTLEDVAGCVGKALADAGIRAVLTGGACATLYTRGTYQSEDLDFILQSGVSAPRLELVMNGAGFKRRGNQYFHEKAPFYVEFPAGPLAIGRDFRVEPVEYTIHRTRLLALSPTDSCRDRLAAFYHWGDRGSLAIAVEIARRHRIQLKKVERWSKAEGSLERFREFATEVRRARRGAGRRPGRKRR